MGRAEQLITENLELWSSAVKAKASAGRGSSKKPEIYGVAKLRGVILDLAVSGLLVQQDPEEEDAVKLLQRIKTEKSELISKKTIKKEKNVLPVDLHEVKNSLPKQWALCRLSDIASVIRGITFPASEKSNTPENGRIACLRTSNIQEEITWEDLLYIRERFMKREDQTILKGDIIMSMANSRELVGKVAIVKSTPEDKITFGGFLAVIRPIIIEPEYLMAFLRSTNTRNKIIKSASQTTNIANISLGKLNPIILPIPPLKEQRRIVAKVNELMALCDQLEQEQDNNLKTHETLVSTLLNALTSASTDASQFADAWHRIQDKFDILFTTESSIDQLKQTILQLAVTGKLLLQDENDSPAEKLLEQISIEKAHLVKTGKIKKQKKPSHLAPEDEPFRLPSGWSWCSLLEICTLENGDRSKNYPNKSMLVETGIPFVNAGDLENGYISEKANSFITEERYEILNSGKFQNGDILFCLRGSLGKSAIVNGFNKGAIASSLVIIRSFSAINEHFLQKYFESPFAAHMISLYDNGTAQPNLSATDLGKFCVPIPPYKEQFRIVSKIDELLSVCDQLKANLSTAQEIQATLADSIVEQAIHSPA